MATGRADRRSWTRWLVVALPYLWSIVLFLGPFLIVLKISFSTTVIAQPPYTPVFDLVDGIGGLLASAREFTVDNYIWLTSDALYIRAYLSSLRIAAIATFLTLLIG